MQPRVRADEVLTERSGDEVLIYDTHQHVAHRLTPSAAVVWRCADGTRTLDELVQAVRDNGWTEADRALVLAVLDSLAEVNLLADGPPPDADRLSRREALARVAGIALPFVASILVPTPLEAGYSGTSTPVTPTPNACSVTISPANASVPASGGSGTVAATGSTSSCEWTVTSTASWLRADRTSATGSANVGWVADANPTTSARSGTIEFRSNLGMSALLVSQAARAFPDFNGAFDGTAILRQPSQCGTFFVANCYISIYVTIGSDGKGTLRRILTATNTTERIYNIDRATWLPNGNLEVRSGSQSWTFGNYPFTGELVAVVSQSEYTETETLSSSARMCTAYYDSTAKKR